MQMPGGENECAVDVVAMAMAAMVMVADMVPELDLLLL